jgi:hypothetical protein
MKTEGGGEWYKSIRTVKLSGQQFSFAVLMRLRHERSIKGLTAS